MELLLLIFLSLASGGAVVFGLVRLDSRPGIPRNTVFLWIFPWVGALSVLPGFFLYGIAAAWGPPLPGRWGEILFTWLVNAPVEELAKYGSFTAATLVLRSLREPQDGILQGAATGLGFAVVENFLYGLSGGWELLLVRAFLSLPGHVVYGAVWGGYHGFESYQGKGRVVRWWIPLLALFPAAFSHALFNTLALVGAPLPVILVTDLLTLALGAFLFVRLRAHSPSRISLPLKEWRRAVPELEHALAVDPRSELLRRKLAAYLLAGNQPQRALSILEPLAESPWTRFYRDAALRRRDGPSGPLPASSSLNPKLFRALSGG